MSSSIRVIGTVILSFGVDPRRMWAALRALPHFAIDLATYLKSRDAMERRRFRLNLVPTLSDLYAESGTARGHYFHQDLWAARHVHARNPRRHVDVGSRLDGFVAHLLTFRDVEVIDIRTLSSSVRGLRFVQADMMNPVGPSLIADSVSCLHALEHFGLGRYGDPVDLNGWRKGLRNLAGIVAMDGTLLLSVPIGRQRVEFNAQRVFDPATIVAEATELGLSLHTFSFVDDQGDFHEDRRIDEAVDLDFGCGCFAFERVAQQRLA